MLSSDPQSASVGARTVRVGLRYRGRVSTFTALPSSWHWPSALALARRWWRCYSSRQLASSRVFRSSKACPRCWRLGPAWIVVIPIIGSLIGGPIIARWAIEAKGHGVPEVLQAIILRGGRIRPRVALVKSIASTICIGTGALQGVKDLSYRWAPPWALLPHNS